MKTKWKITSFAMIAMLISCGGGTNEQNNTAETTEESTPQMTTYDSPNSLYSISVPNEYEQKSTDNVRLIARLAENGDYYKDYCADNIDSASKYFIDKMEKKYL